MKILFICKGNWFRSQMAAGIYNYLTCSNDAESVGVAPGILNEPEGSKLKNLYKSSFVFQLMDAINQDIREHSTRRLHPEMLDQYDLVVSMVEEPFSPDFLMEDKRVIWWEVANPDTMTQQIAEDTFKQLRNLILDLAKTHHIPLCR